MEAIFLSYGKFLQIPYKTKNNCRTGAEIDGNCPERAGRQKLSPDSPRPTLPLYDRKTPSARIWALIHIFLILWLEGFYISFIFL
jgi:hypothetical protein